MNRTIEGLVVRIDPQGDLITNIAIDQVDGAPANDTVRVRVGPHETMGIFDKDHNEPESTMIAVRGDSGFLEIGIVGMNMSDMLGIHPGERVVVQM